MLKNTCKTLTAWLRRHRAACLGLLAGLAAWGLFAAARGNRTAMDWWLAHVSMPVKRGISALGGMGPSVREEAEAREVHSPPCASPHAISA